MSKGRQIRITSEGESLPEKLAAVEGVIRRPLSEEAAFNIFGQRVRLWHYLRVEDGVVVNWLWGNGLIFSTDGRKLLFIQTFPCPDGSGLCRRLWYSFWVPSGRSERRSQAIPLEPLSEFWAAGEIFFSEFLDPKTHRMVYEKVLETLRDHLFVNQ